MRSEEEKLSEDILLFEMQMLLGILLYLFFSFFLFYGL